MAHIPHFSYWLLVCWLVVTVAEGQEEVFTPPGSSLNNVNPTDCQIFTLTPPPTPPPTTRNLVTRVQPITRTPKYTSHFFPQRRPRVYPSFPNGPFLPPECNHRFQFQPFYWSRGSLNLRRYFLRRKLQKGSSSEESGDD